jgi:two-component system, NarL family, invasion response regulator UvrY
MRVLLADDQEVLRRGVRALLAESLPGAVFDETSASEHALCLITQHRYDLIVLDLALPRLGGIEGLKRMRLLGPAVPLLVIGQHPEEQYAVRVLRAGAAGYVTKSCAGAELVKAARKAIDGGKYVSETLAESLACGLTHAEQRLHDLLSDRELDVLRLLAEGKAVKQIADELSLSEKTVSTYRTRILEKTRLSGTAELMRFAMRAGLAD